MIIDLKRSIHLRWLFLSGAIFISDNLIFNFYLLQELEQTSLRRGQLKDIIKETCKLDVLFKITSKAIQFKSGLLTKQTAFKIYPPGTMKLCSEQSITIMKIQIHPTVSENTQQRWRVKRKDCSFFYYTSSFPKNMCKINQGGRSCAGARGAPAEKFGLRRKF